MREKKVGKQDSFQLRPPVVAVVGHIDHGKTTLLDKIRRSRIASREAGGITQHIGASQIEFENKEGEIRKITFIDTPGHAAFTQMRARGVETTDLVVLVVAADEGPQEQTKESLAHIKAAKVSFLVAINKIDLPAADVEKVKGQLAEIGIVPEDYGGDVVVVPVSAKTGKGIDNLLEMILLMTDLLELKADPEGELMGVVIESTLDKRKGPLATILIKNGSLKRGEEIFAEITRARVKVMHNWRGEAVDQALPGDVVEVLGFEGVPSIGALVSRTPKEPKVKKKKKETVSDEDFLLKIIIKADVHGSLEALIHNLPEGVEVIYSGVGEVTDGDLFLAQTTGADIFAFNVKTTPAAKRAAEENNLSIFQAGIIYEILEEIKERLKKSRDPLAGKDVFGRAEVIAQFKVNGKKVAGCRVTEGEILADKKVLLMRNNEVIGQAKVISMKHLKERIEKAEKGQEFGLVISPSLDFKLGDAIISHSDGESDEEGRSLSEDKQPHS